MKKTPLKKYNKKSVDKRKGERKDYPEFYKRHVQIIKDSKLFCEECGHQLIGDVSEVCHILPKSNFKSIATLDENIKYLCSWKSKNNCHALFDNGTNEQIKQMKIFNSVVETFELIKREVTERINYKTEERYSCQH